MIFRRSLKIIFILTLSFYFSHCKPEQFFLHGGIGGTVTDSLTSQPVSGAIVSLYPLLDSTTTNNNGKFSFGNISPGIYKVKVAKESYYFDTTLDCKVVEGETQPLNFSLRGLPSPYFSSSYLDFGFDSIVKHFTISNKGEGTLKFSIQFHNYPINPFGYPFIYKNWVNIQPPSGEISKGLASITVSINRDSIPIGEKQTYVWIIISDQFLKNYTIPVLANGILDKDLHYYGIVNIGTQTWLSQNIDAGIFIDTHSYQINNQIIEKYCIDNSSYNCDNQGGLYTWGEMMRYSPSDSSSIGTTQGVCPVGWHIPTYKEWETLIDYYGGTSVAGDSLKMSPDFAYWLPNTPKTFEAMQNGYFDGTQKKFDDSNFATFYSATEFSPDLAYYIKLHIDTPSAEFGIISKSAALSVRCIKN